MRGVAGCGADLRWARCASHWSDNNTVLHHHLHPSLLSAGEVMLISDTIIIYLLINIAITQLMSNSAVLYKKQKSNIDCLCPIAIAIENLKKKIL